MFSGRIHRIMKVLNKRDKKQNILYFLFLFFEKTLSSVEMLMFTNMFESIEIKVHFPLSLLQVIPLKRAIRWTETLAGA